MYRGALDLKTTVRPKIWLPKSDHYSAVNFLEKSYPYSALFQSFLPVRAKIFAIFQENVEFFLQNWTILLQNCVAYTNLTVSTLKVPFDWVEIYSTPPLIAVSTLKVLTAKSKNKKWTTTVLTVMMSHTNCLTPLALLKFWGIDLSRERLTSPTCTKGYSFKFSLLSLKEQKRQNFKDFGDFSPSLGCLKIRFHEKCWKSGSGKIILGTTIYLKFQDLSAYKKAVPPKKIENSIATGK